MFETLMSLVAQIRGNVAQIPIPEETAVYRIPACPDCVAAIQTGRQDHLAQSQRAVLGRHQAQAQLKVLLHEDWQDPPTDICRMCGGADYRKRAIVQMTMY